MAVTPTALTITPTWSAKRLTVTGDAAVRESVALTISGCSDDTSIVFKVSSEDGRVDYAKFPFAAGDAWTVSGDDLTGTLNLNTDLLVAAFASLGPDDRLPFSFSVASATNANLYAKGCKQIGNWCENIDDPVAYATPLSDAVESAQADLDVLEAVFAAHDHDGTDSPKVAHGNLNDIGVNTHAAIDAALVTLASGVATNASNIAIQTGRIDELEGTGLTTGDFASVDALASGSTVKQVIAKVNALIAILKG